MKHLISVISVLIIFLIISFETAYAQLTINANTYRFNAANSSLIAITPTQLIPSNSDNVSSAVTNIGFTFWFAGVPYTQFSVSENGLMTLGSTQITGADVINNLASATTLPKIAPYWDDLSTGTNGSVGYQLSGTAPNRVLYVNWNVTVPKNTAGAANASFQVQLYETGNIFFTFGTIGSNSGQYSMGIGVSAADFASVNVTGDTYAVCTYGTANNSQTISPGSGKRYQFAVDNTAPTITSGTIPNTAGTGNRTLTATIGDQAGVPVSGIPVSGGYVPRIYFKKNAGGIYTSTPGVLTSGNGNSGTWSFTVDHTLLGGVNQSDQIYYFLVAQDQADYKGNPNIKSYPAGVSASNVNTIISPPSGVPYYIVGGSYSGTVTVGTGGDFNSLTQTGGLFEILNAGELTGNLTVNIISDLTENGAKGLNAWVNTGGGPFTITINPVGHRVISGATINGGTANLITLNGVSGVTIDGLNDGINSLTISQTGQYLVGSAIDIKGSNNTITRTTIKGYGASNHSISISNTTVPSINNTISYCNITSSVLIPNTANAGNGIGLLAVTSTGDNNLIDHNVVTNFVYNGIVVSGKFSNTVISNNEVYNTIPTAWNNNFRGIQIGSSIVGTTNVFNNKVHDLLVQTNASSTGIPAISVSAGTAAITNIYNNVIYLDASYTHPMQTWYGIQTSGAGTVNVYYNSIYIGGTNVTAVTTAYGSYGFKKDGTGNTNFKNNAVFNARSNSTGTGKHYGIFAGPGIFTSNNNDIFVNGTGGIFGNSSGADRLTLADWQTATSQDLASFSANPGFTSAADLTPDIMNPASGTLDNHGVPVASVAADILGNPRSTSLPTPTDIGAYEFTGVPVLRTISGNAGLPGVTLSWTDVTDKNIVSDGSGNYSFTVTDNWSGTVTPILTGYTFTPVNRSYTNVLTDQINQDFTPAPIVYTISGNAGAPGVILSYDDGGIKTAVSGTDGLYSLTISYNWSGTVTPSLTGFYFTPSNRTYTNVLADQSNQDFTSAPILFTISGNAGAPGVTLSYDDGGIKTVISDADGLYTLSVSFNWSGTVSPALEGYSFTPSNISYNNVQSDQINQNYIAAAIVYNITGNAGAAGVVLSYYDGGIKTVTAGTDGNYSLTVSYNWTGMVTPELAGYNFTPLGIKYANVLSDFVDQNYTADAILYTISGNAGAAGVKLDYDDGGIKSVVSDPDGLYSLTVSYNWSGTVTPVLEGFYFEPSSILYSNVLSDQPDQNYTAFPVVLTISGTTGLPGTVLSYNDGGAKSVAAGVNGDYSFTVSYNWTGIVTPELAGYTFTPSNISYSNVQSDLTAQNYTGTAIAFAISGNAGAAGVTLSYDDGGSKTVISDAGGLYTLNVSYNWSGTVTPSLPGFTFTPANISYTNILADQANQDYSAAPVILTISGTTGVAGTVLSYNDGGIKTVTAGTNGDYSFTIPYNWSGTVTPALTAYSFTPANITYTNVVSDQTLQNYTPAPVVFVISGSTGVPGATISWTDGTAKTITTNGSGNYSLTVSYNWSGTVTPSDPGYIFTPASKTYNNVLSDQPQQDYTAAMITFTISGKAGVGGAVLSWTDGTKKTLIADAAGNYSFAVSYNWSGSVTPSLAGYIFTPAVNTYSGVLTDQADQNFTAVPVTPAISGNTGTEGVTLRWTDGTVKTITSGVNGNYSLNVSYNWTGTIVPSKAGYTFSPLSRSYKKITTNQMAQNYSAVPVVYTISGRTSVGKVVLSWTDGTAKSVTSGGSGNYSFTVSYNWSGTVTPSLNGYTFNPLSRSYTNVQGNFTGQNYTAVRLAKVHFTGLVVYNNVEITGVSEPVENLIVEVERKTKTGDWKKIGMINPEFQSSTQAIYKFIDKKVPNDIYSYRFKEIFKEGDFVYSKEIQVEVNAVPLAFKLEQNYPNPFNPSTTINYELPMESEVTLQIFSVIGERVAELVNDVQPAGFYSHKWNAGNLPSGIYLLRIDARKIGSDERFVKTLRLVIMK